MGEEGALVVTGNNYIGGIYHCACGGLFGVSEIVKNFSGEEHSRGSKTVFLALLTLCTFLLVISFLEFSTLPLYMESFCNFTFFPIQFLLTINKTSHLSENCFPENWLFSRKHCVSYQNKRSCISVFAFACNLI